MFRLKHVSVARVAHASCNKRCLQLIWGAFKCASYSRAVFPVSQLQLALFIRYRDPEQNIRFERSPGHKQCQKWLQIMVIRFIMNKECIAKNAWKTWI